MTLNFLELNNLIPSLEVRFDKLSESFHSDFIHSRLQVLEQTVQHPSFWQDQKKAQTIIQEQNDLQGRLDSFAAIRSDLETIQLTAELASLDESFDLSEVEDIIYRFEQALEELTIKVLLNQPYDKFNAIVEFHPGAGGTESQDWAEMLYRMMTRWADSKRFKMTVLDYQEGEEAGIKSVTIQIVGAYAYGYLKSEHGVHRLVRLSPFDSSGRRHTSFASISVVPEIDESIEVEINESDLRIDTYRSGGNGGQSVNTTDSAVRITHIPTKTVVTCQNERSQMQNKETALKVLRGKLYQLELEKKQQERDIISGSKLSNGFGSQIRSYVFHPYSMVKDHRTDYETGNTQRVMDGDLDPFINAYLREYNRQKAE
jgi:peptide chain release factor 2